MYILTNKEMREADAYTIEKLGVPSLELMERAGNVLANEAARLAPTGRILCVCGGGNNGGDGFVCARLLKERGRKADVLFCGGKQTTDCRVNHEKWLRMGGRVYTDFAELTEAMPIGEYTLIVDCLFGTGFRGRLDGAYERLVRSINECGKSGAKILSADIPSGVNGDNGTVEGVAVHADETLCIGELKSGVLLSDGIDHAGKIRKADIGIKLLPNASYAELTDSVKAAALLPRRKRNSHKGTYGKAAIVAGCAEYTGAAYLATAACLRAGAGYTTLFVPEAILPYYILKSPEALLRPISAEEALIFEEARFVALLSYDSIAYGMGMGVSEDVAKGACYLLTNYRGRLILDADGLNSLAAYEKERLETLFKHKKCDVVLTPHLKEFSRLSGKSVEDIVKEGLFSAKDFAVKHGVCVLLKNAVSVITDGVCVAVNAAGTSGQAKGGSGDVLSGVIAGLCACGLSAFEGACAATYVVGKAAENATAKTGTYSLTATDIISHLGGSFLEIMAPCTD